jgi:nicotinamide mononucleotide transporter PnuC
MKTHKKIIIAITGIAILFAGIFFKQELFLMVPLFVSLFVMSFQSEANRIGSLIGAINAVIYTAAYLYMGVYVSAASALFMSVPLQLATFFNWKKNAYKKTVVFKKMSVKMRVVSLVALLISWSVSAGALTLFKYEYAIFDTVTFLLGLAVSILTMLAYIEYTYLWIISAVTGLIVNIQMVINNPKEITYLIYGVYALYCVIVAFINVQKFYKEQQNIEKIEEQKL